MVSLKVLQLELSPPHTPHLSSCFEEPTTPSQPTFCSWGHGKFNTRRSGKLAAVSLSHTPNSTHLALPTHTHAVRVLVWAARAVQDHSLHEDHIPRLFGLAMQVAAFGSCETDTNKNDPILQTVVSEWHICDPFWWSHLHNKRDYFYFLNELSMSQHVSLCLSVWVILHEPQETKPGSSSQWEWTLLLHHLYYRWT